ncbi:MAG: ABC transporter substrate-binding protein [Deltaproteobacteria bacterium]|nr:ABC transporter substrate-binding protein [Deltaproteobacteria bacterium]
MPAIPKGTAVMLVEQQPRNIDPLHAADAVSQKIDNLLHASLVRATPSMGLEPYLAESWKVRGYRDFSFTLREGLRFHDGSPLDAAAVVRALELYRGDSPHAIALKHVRRIWAEGARHVRLETDSPQPFLLHDFPLLKIFKRDGARIVGAGRYKVVSEKPDEIRAVAVDGAFDAVPADGFREIVFRHVADDTTRYQRLVRGDGNVLLSALSLTKTDYLRKNPPRGLAIVDAAGVNYSYLAFNFRNPRLANLKVRQAIAHAIDVDDVIEHRIRGFGRRASGILAPAHRDYYEPDVESYAYDAAKAERLLDEAGYPRREGGWRFPLFFKTTTDKFGNELARIVVNELRHVGIDARLDIVEPGTFFAQVNAGNFDMFHSRWIGVNSPAIYFRAFHSSQAAPKGMNRGAYSSPELDRLLELGMNEVDDARRKGYFSKAQKLVARELPYVSLFHWNNTFIGTDEMKHIVMYPNGDYRTLADVRLGSATP